MSVLIQLADAVAGQLNAETFSLPFTATRQYRPIFDLEEMTDLHVTVVPRGVSSKGLDRSRDSYDYQIDVAVQQKTEMTPAELDALMSLVEELADRFQSQPLSAMPEARCVEVTNVPAYSAEHLEDLRQFTSVLTLTYRLWR